MKHLIFPSLVAAALVMTLLPCAPAQAKVTEEECKADYVEMVNEAERNRIHSLDELNRELRYTTDDGATESVNQMINQTWEIEESFITHAANAYRDCLKYARSPDQ